MKGRQLDAFLYRESEIDSELQQTLNIGGVQYCIHADQAYQMRPWMQQAYRDPTNQAEKLFNNSMNRMRTGVE